MTVELRESPAGHLAAACAEASVSGVVELREVPFLPQTEVRGRDDATVARVLGPLPAPEQARALGADAVVLWCGPGWYLMVGGCVPADGDDGGVSVVEVSAARTTLEVRGPRARDVLGHGCRVDLHPRVFGPGSAVRTNLARATVVLHQVGDAPAYRIHVGASYADYLVTWLLDAMVPYVAG